MAEPLAWGQEQPELDSLTRNPDQTLTVTGTIPAGYRNALLEVLHGDAVSTRWMPHVSGPLNGGRSSIIFTLPDPGARCIVRLRVGDSETVPAAPFSGSAYMLPSYGEGGTYVPTANRITHLLNRIAYGASVPDYTTVQTMGIPSFIAQQLNPASIDESGNTALNSRTGALFHSFLPYAGTPMVRRGDVARYFKGNVAPPTNWKAFDFDDTTWASGPTGIGYGGSNSATVLADMQANTTAVPPVPGYYSYFVRLPFTMTADDIAAVENLVLNITFDDGFVAYLNGTEAARNNVNGNPPTHNTAAITSGGNVNGTAPGTYVLNTFKGSLRVGANVLAVQVHNQSLTSSDAGMNAELVSVGDAPYTAIRGSRELQHLIHVRGVYAKRQLQAVLGEFWENHFTTEFPKVEDYLLNRNEFAAIANQSLEAEARIGQQAELEALSMEFREYEFFHANALGDFGDLLLYSATSPSMLIYLDNILNKKGAPNENYAREILELHGFGVDNRYTQTDIEQLARCFTGWSVRKIHPGDAQGFPGSARTPPTDDSIAVGNETAVLAIGETWKYFKGTGEPSGGTTASSDWAQPSYNDTLWLSGPSGFGYSDGDDNTVLLDMQQRTGVPGYISVFLRKQFVIPDPASYDKLLLDIDYDDGFVVYLNGTEIGRSSTMSSAGSPPPFSALGGSHEAGQGTPTLIDLATVVAQRPGLLNIGGLNTLAIQAHNGSKTSGDFSILPRLRAQTYTAQSIAVTNPEGLWTFRFDPNEHDRGAKTIFAGTPYQIVIPATTANETGLDDAIDVIDAMIGHPSTAEFISLKLVNRFVSDEITLGSYHNRSAPDYLLNAVDRAIVAWNSTSPKGNIATVMTSILDPARQISAFWLEGAQLGKVKNPVEFINSSFRALGADIASTSLPVRTTGMGMFLFTRPEPDGFSEEGGAWMDTQSLLQRMKFAQGLGSNQTYSYGAWNLSTWMTDNLLTTPQSVVAHLNAYVFGGTLTAERQAVYVRYADTDDNGVASPYANLSATNKVTRMRQVIGLILSSPEFQYQ